MDKVTIKKYLNSIRNISTRLETRVKEVESLREDITTLKATDYTKDIVQGNKGADIADSVVKLIEVEKEVMQEVTKLIQLRERARMVIHNISNAYAEKVLILKYIDCNEWYEITETLNYSRRQVNNFHDEGIQAILKDKISVKQLEYIYEDVRLTQDCTRLHKNAQKCNKLPK